MDHGKVVPQLIQLVAAHEELPRRRLVGGGKNGVTTARIQPDLFRHRVRLGIGDQVLADLTVDVVAPVSAVEGVEADSHTVDQLVRVVGMHQDPHRGHQVVDAMKLPFRECPEGPQAGEHLLERLVDALLRGLVRVLSLGVVESGAVEPRQILVVGAGAVAERLPCGVRGVHGGQRVDDPLRALRILDVVAQIIEHVILDLEVRAAGGHRRGFDDVSRWRSIVPDFEHGDLPGARCREYPASAEGPELCSDAAAPVA